MFRCPECGSFKRVNTPNAEYCKCCGHLFFFAPPGQKPYCEEPFWSWAWWPVLLTAIMVMGAILTVIATS